jgi:hypothetical protein
MGNKLKQVFNKVPFCYLSRDYWAIHRQKRELFNWEKAKRPVPPPFIFKSGVVREYSIRYNLKILVETGTYHGNMVEAMKMYFDKIYSIELSYHLYNRNVRRFKGIASIVLIQGDSGKEIEKIIRKLNQPALFWLDAHYSGGSTARGKRDTPIYEELSHILNATNIEHVILIDDARCFGTERDYPSLDEIKSFVNSKRINYKTVVCDDIIRITPDLSATKGM